MSASRAMANSEVRMTKWSTQDDPQFFFGKIQPQKWREEKACQNDLKWLDSGHCFIFGFLLDGHVRDIQPLRCSQNPWFQTWNPAMPKTRHLESPGKTSCWVFSLWTVLQDSCVHLWLVQFETKNCLYYLFDNPKITRPTPSFQKRRQDRPPALIFDWDDTLCPTSWMRPSGWWEYPPCL